MIRRLTDEERELWSELRRSVRPLRPRRAPSSPAAAPAPAEARPPAAVDRHAGAESDVTRSSARSGVPPLAGLEARTARRLARGLVEVDARIDLHGMRQERAFSALFSFLRHAQLRGSKLVLVITGKGRDSHERQGVLHRAVPAWLSRPDFRDLVLGFQEAGRRHGGAGALYVRVRRRRDARRADQP